MTSRLETISSLYDQSHELLVQRGALQDAQSLVSAQQGRVLDQILALDFDDEEFTRKHDYLNGKHSALHDAWMDIQNKMKVLTKRSSELREKADKIVDTPRSNA